MHPSTIPIIPLPPHHHLVGHASADLHSSALYLLSGAPCQPCHNIPANLLISGGGPLFFLGLCWPLSAVVRVSRFAIREAVCGLAKSRWPDKGLHEDWRRCSDRPCDGREAKLPSSNRGKSVVGRDQLRASRPSRAHSRRPLRPGLLSSFLIPGGGTGGTWIILQCQ